MLYHFQASSQWKQEILKIVCQILTFRSKTCLNFKQLFETSYNKIWPNINMRASKHYIICLILTTFICLLWLKNILHHNVKLYYKDKFIFYEDSLIDPTPLRMRLFVGLKNQNS